MLISLFVLTGCKKERPWFYDYSNEELSETIKNAIEISMYDPAVFAQDNNGIPSAGEYKLSNLTSSGSPFEKSVFEVMGINDWSEIYTKNVNNNDIRIIIGSGDRSVIVRFE